jgi:hypothetical protein
MCADLGGQCITERDGYYMTTGLCISFGICLLLFYVIPTARRLEGKPALLHRIATLAHDIFAQHSLYLCGGFRQIDHDRDNGCVQI